MIRAALVCLAVGSIFVATGADARPQEERPRGTYIRVPAPERNQGGMMFGAGGRAVIFMNRDGGQYSGGGWTDDSTTNQSSILSWTANVPAYPYGDGSWNQLMACMRDLYAPFNVDVTDVDPGNASHLEVVVGGHPGDIGMSSGIGGVAPMACEPIPNAIVYAFPETYGDDPQGICEAAGQESAHAYGLDHEYLCEDIMTYLYGCGAKTFQDQDVSCGEYSERACSCGGATQNSYQYLMGVLGPAEEQDSPPSVAITRPADGAEVSQGFTVDVEANDDNGVTRVDLYVDGELVDTDNSSPWSLDAPDDLGAGPHQVEVRAVDGAAGVGSDSITVDVNGDDPDPGDDPDDDDDDADPGVDPGDDPDPGVDPGQLGEFGDACSRGDGCSSRACVTVDEGDGYCTESCDGDSCPYGFSCSDTAQGAFCMLEDEGGFGGGGGGEDTGAGLTASSCSASGAPNGSSSWLLACVALLGLALLRRK
ncbi:MAG: Ig-like domain-containing protein [Deltaproteobacteria bacterium]|nr:Ig-like domain-containing protein [Deltaproteobacteria bacterium]